MNKSNSEKPKKENIRLEKRMSDTSIEVCAHVACVNKMFVPYRECHNTDSKDLGDDEYGALEDKSIGAC